MKNLKRRNAQFLIPFLRWNMRISRSRMVRGLEKPSQMRHTQGSRGEDTAATSILCHPLVSMQFAREQETEICISLRRAVEDLQKPQEQVKQSVPIKTVVWWP